MNRTIPELAEELRHHLNNDNDAKRLITEHVLPLIGIDVDSFQHLEDTLAEHQSMKELVSAIKIDLKNLLSDINDHG